MKSTWIIQILYRTCRVIVPGTMQCNEPWISLIPKKVPANFVSEHCFPCGTTSQDWPWSKAALMLTWLLCQYWFYNICILNNSNNYVIKDVIKTTWVLTWHPNWEEGRCTPVGPYWPCSLVNVDRLGLVCKKAQWHYVKAEDRSAGRHKVAPRECRCHPAGPRSRLPFRLHFGNTRLENMDVLTTNDPSLTFCWSVIALLIVFLFQ